MAAVCFAMKIKALCWQLSALPESRVRSISTFISKVEKSLSNEFSALEQPEAYGKSVLLILSDSEEYYQYIGKLEQEDGYFPMSSATFVDGNCPHFVTHEGEIASIKPIIVHELTHDFLSDLNLPVWLGEGIAAYMECRFAPGYGLELRDARAHLKYWAADTHSFWDGTSFSGNSAEAAAAEVLAVLLVQYMVRSEMDFVEFLRRCKGLDGHQVKAVAADCLSLSLDDMVNVLVNSVD